MYRKTWRIRKKQSEGRGQEVRESEVRWPEVRKARKPEDEMIRRPETGESCGQKREEQVMKGMGFGIRQLDLLFNGEVRI
jgi:hypothetical protein